MDDGAPATTSSLVIVEIATVKLWSPSSNVSGSAITCTHSGVVGSVAEGGKTTVNGAATVKSSPAAATLKHTLKYLNFPSTVLDSK